MQVQMPGSLVLFLGALFDGRWPVLGVLDISKFMGWFWLSLFLVIEGILLYPFGEFGFQR
jgi:hypothetical protein